MMVKSNKNQLNDLFIDQLLFKVKENSCKIVDSQGLRKKQQKFY